MSRWGEGGGRWNIRGACFSGWRICSIDADWRVGVATSGVVFNRCIPHVVHYLSIGTQITGWLSSRSNGEVR